MPFRAEKTPKRFASTAMVVALVIGLHAALLAFTAGWSKTNSEDFPVQYIDNANAPAVQTLAQVRNESIALSPHGTLALSLSTYRNLPTAQLLVAQRKSRERSSSFAYPQDKGNGCLVQLTVAEHNHGVLHDAHDGRPVPGAHGPSSSPERVRSLARVGPLPASSIGLPFFER